MNKQSTHIFSVDVEEYFQVNAFEKRIERADWLAYPSRLSSSIDILLDLLARHNATGTFFVLGWVGQHHRNIVRRIADAGHEIASHGWWHRKLTSLTPAEFRLDVQCTKNLLEQVVGKPVLGYRAPSFSL